MAITSKQKKLLIAILVALISAWHYSTNVHHPVLHILHRELYLIPIVLAAYWFGKKGGLTTSVTASLIFVPWIFMAHEPTFANQLNNVLEILSFNVVAYLLGIYRDARKAQYTISWRPEAEKAALKPGGRNVLLVIDNSANAAKISRYVVNNFALNSGMTITILGFIREPSQDLFVDPVEFVKAREAGEQTIASLVGDARETLLSRGIPAETIRTKTVRVRKETIASMVLKEQKAEPCDTLVVGGTKLSKAEEFVFGNLAVKLIREAGCPVVTVY